MILLCSSEMFHLVESTLQSSLGGNDISQAHGDGDFAMEEGEVARYMRASPLEDEGHFGEAGQRNGEAGQLLTTTRRTAISGQPSPRLQDCILLFGAFCNGETMTTTRRLICFLLNLAF